MASLLLIYIHVLLPGSLTPCMTDCWASFIEGGRGCMNTSQRLSDSGKQFCFQIPMMVASALLLIPFSGLTVTQVGSDPWETTYAPERLGGAC
jgi:hypothetical protein